MKTVALVVAAGRGLRAGTDIPKQYSALAGQPVLLWTLRRVLAHESLDGCLVVIHADDRARYDNCVAAFDDPRLLDPALGGADRQASVRLGLEALAGLSPDHVLIHDAARPLVSRDVVDRVLAKTMATGAALAAMPVIDTLWRDAAGTVSEPVSRDKLWSAQTPQGFRYDMILKAHRRAAPGATDDVAIAHAAGHEVSLVAGDVNNFKITLPEDFARAEKILGG